MPGRIIQRAVAMTTTQAMVTADLRKEGVKIKAGDGAGPVQRFTPLARTRTVSQKQRTQKIAGRINVATSQRDNHTGRPTGVYVVCPQR